MNISFVSDAIYPYNKGGKEKRLYELSTRLSKLGHDVHVYTMHWWDTAETVRIENGVHLHAISKCYPMYSGDKRSIKEGVMFGLACLKLIRIKFDIMDVDQMPFFPVYSTWLICRIRGKKLYGTWHEALSRNDWRRYMGALGNLAYAIEDITIRLPDIISSSSAQTIDGLNMIHGRYENVKLVTPGIDLASISSVKPAKIASDIIYIGRLVKDKNVDKLILAVALLSKKDTSISCTIIGHGVEKDNLIRLIKRMKLEHNVRLLQPLEKDTEIYSHIKAAKVFCLPSIREGFGMAVLESLACGTPVVTSAAQANSARHLIEEGRNGSIVNEGIDNLALALEEGLNKPKPYNIADQVKHYDWNALAKKQEAVYLS